jgi:HSP20 family protein
MNALIRRPSPFLVDSDSIFNQFENLFRERFSDFFEPSSAESLSLFEKSAYPRLDIRNEPDKVVVDVEVPGLTKEDIKVEINDGVLIVRGDKRKDTEEKGGNYIRKELKRSSFSRQVCQLNENCDIDRISADFVAGMLTIIVPKKKVESTQKPQVKQVVINSSDEQLKK